MKPSDYSDKEIRQMVQHGRTLRSRALRDAFVALRDLVKLSFTSRKTARAEG